jgi:hypothetical protein
MLFLVLEACAVTRGCLNDPAYAELCRGPELAVICGCNAGLFREALHEPTSTSEQPLAHRPDASHLGASAPHR